MKEDMARKSLHLLNEVSVIVDKLYEMVFGSDHSQIEREQEVCDGIVRLHSILNTSPFYKCVICSKRFVSEYRLWKHYLTQHPLNNPNAHNRPEPFCLKQRTSTKKSCLKSSHHKCYDTSPPTYAECVDCEDWKGWKE
jgi:hypothetical protein